MQKIIIALLLTLLLTSCVGPITHTTYTPGIDEYGAYVDVDNPAVDGVTRLYRTDSGYTIKHSNSNDTRSIEEIIGDRP